MPPDRPLLYDIERFLREQDMPPTRFGRQAVGDPRFVLDLRNGREPRQPVRCRAEHFMNKVRATRAGKAVP